MTTEQFQRHRPAPNTVEEFRALLDAGGLITTGGKRLVRRACPDCGSLLFGSRDGTETCWCTVRCPQCLATAGKRCSRPSGHNVFGDQPHSGRVRAAQGDTERRALAGDPDLPARWPVANDNRPTLW